MQRKQLGKLDEADVFPDGVFAFPPTADERKVKIRALGEYCKKKGLHLTNYLKRKYSSF